mmetsp:Transcript_7898/g.9388  ORF Transcript_7898/g.9388 Transcript_7898/m.9388 type:complete len:120 (-) Transcript_7898:63-422(-)
MNLDYKYVDYVLTHHTNIQKPINGGNEYDRLKQSASQNKIRSFFEMALVLVQEVIFVRGSCGSNFIRSPPKKASQPKSRIYPTNCFRHELKVFELASSFAKSKNIPRRQCQANKAQKYL